MISVPIGPQERMIVVAAPDYLARFGVLHYPRDLTDHDCIQIRMPTAQAPIPWEFEKKGEALNVRVSGRIVCNSKVLQIDAARRGLGLAWLLQEPQVNALIASGDLVTVLDDWCDPFPGSKEAGRLSHPLRQHAGDRRHASSRIAGRSL